MVADGDSSSRYCSENDSEDKYDHENENEECIVVHGDNDSNCLKISKVYSEEPRLEIARSGVVAKRLTPTLIAYPSVVLAKKSDTSVDTKRRSLENASNSSLSVMKEKKSHKELSYKSGRKEENLRIEGNGNSSKVVEREKNVPVLSMKNNDSTRDTVETIKASVDSKNINTASSSKTRLKTKTKTKRKTKTNTKTKATDVLLDSDFEISKKYNLDSTDMSLIYSLTPLLDPEYQENLNEERTLRESLSSLSSMSVERTLILDRSVGERRIYEEGCNYDWFDSSYDDDSDTYESFDEICAEMRDEVSSDSECFEILSKEGLPSDAIFELVESNGELFENGISESANEIIAELDACDTLASISSLLDEIFQRVCDTLFYRSFSRSFARSRVFNLISSSTLAKEDDGVFSRPQNAPRQTIFSRNHLEENSQLLIVHEIIHHVIDVHDESVGERSNVSPETIDCSFKSAKDIANVELKEGRDATESAAAAVFEFCTIASNVDDTALRLNFRVEKADCAKTIVDANEIIISNSSDLEKSENFLREGKQSDDRTVIDRYSKPSDSLITLLRNSSLACSESANSASNRDISTTSCSQSEEMLMESSNESDMTELANNLDVECTEYCTEFCMTKNHDKQDCFRLSPINEEVNDTMITNYRGDTEIDDGRHNATYTCFDFDFENDQGLELMNAIQNDR